MSEQPNEQLTRLMPIGNFKSVVITLLAACVSFGLYSVLPFEDAANKGLAILLFVAILWFTEAVHITVTALMVPVLAAASGIPEIDTKSALSSFADPIIFIFFGGFALATALHMQKLDRKIALFLISLSGGNMLIAVLLIFAVTAFLSMWISNTATAAMMLPLALGTIVGSPPNAIAAKALDLDFAGWMRYGLPMMLVLLPLMLVSLYVVLRPKFDKADAGQIQSEDIPWTPTRILAAVLFMCTAVAWIFSGTVKEITGVTNPDTWIALAAAVLVVVLGLASWKEVADGTDWGVLMLFGGGIALSVLMQKSGASLVLGQQMALAFAQAHPFIVIFAVAAFIIILTEFTSNTASAALLVPIFASIAVEMNMPVEVMVMVIGIGASCAFMLPVATPPNAIVFGTGLVRQRDMMRVGAVLNALSIVAVSVWAYFFLM